MGRVVCAALVALVVAAGPLRTSLSGRHIFYGQPVTLTVVVSSSPVWRELTVSWYDATGFLVSSSSRIVDENEGGQHFYRIRAQGDPGQWHVYTMLTGAGDKIVARKDDSFEVIPP